uniref:Uncharacterized protein n=1 Tax=Romanomermis culicivorax TaxID=13658 RepID=A0A915J8R8_ROMCU
MKDVHMYYLMLCFNKSSGRQNDNDDKIIRYDNKQQLKQRHSIADGLYFSLDISQDAGVPIVHPPTISMEPEQAGPANPNPNADGVLPLNIKP